MRRLLEAPGQWRNDLQRSAPKCIAHRGRAGATRCNRICLPINTAICCSALPRLQGVAGASPRYRPAAGRLLDWQGNCARRLLEFRNHSAGLRVWQFSVGFNVAVSHNVPVVRMHERETEGVMMRSSAKGDVTRGGHAHARSDALQSAEDFRSAWFHGRRDIVPLAGFYIWQRTPAGYRQPYYVRRGQPSRVWSCGALGALDNRG